MLDFFCGIVIVSLSAAFFLGLAVKWHWLEWLQKHAPNDFLNKLFSCKFCCSWWMSVIISLILCVITGNLWLLAVPVCTTVITRELW